MQLAGSTHAAGVPSAMLLSAFHPELPRLPKKHTNSELKIYNFGWTFLKNYFLDENVFE